MSEKDNIIWICKYCGKDTFDVEADYLVDTDHLECMLKETFSTGLQFEKRYSPLSLTIPASLVEDTPNDQELGEKIRLIYYEAKNLR